FEPNARRLLLLACSVTKPYRSSQSHRFVMDRLADLGVHEEEIDVVTISGLYGPVPRRFESSRSVVEYDFKLTNRHTRQVEVVTQRTQRFLRKYAKMYDSIVVYISSPVYRKVVVDAAR